MWSFIITLSLQVLVIVLALIPLWIFFAAWSFLGPSGFFENVVMLILGWIVLGGAQIMFAIVGFALSLSLWTD